jgi:hypothetical protein
LMVPRNTDGREYAVAKIVDNPETAIIKFVIDFDRVKTVWVVVLEVFDVLFAILSGHGARRWCKWIMFESGAEWLNFGRWRPV